MKTLAGSEITEQVDRGRSKGIQAGVEARAVLVYRYAELLEISPPPFNFVPLAGCEQKPVPVVDITQRDARCQQVDAGIALGPLDAILREDVGLLSDPFLAPISGQVDRSREQQGAESAQCYAHHTKRNAEPLIAPQFFWGWCFVVDPRMRRPIVGVGNADDHCRDNEVREHGSVTRTEKRRHYAREWNHIERAAGDQQDLECDERTQARREKRAVGIAGPTGDAKGPVNQQGGQKKNQND